MNCIAIILDFNSPVISLAFSNDGSVIVSGDEDGNLVVRQTKSLNNFTTLMILIKALLKVMFL